MSAPYVINTQGRDIINSLPGDMSALASIGMGEGLPIWERMAVIIRIRRFNSIVRCDVLHPSAMLF